MGVVFVSYVMALRTYMCSTVTTNMRLHQYVYVMYDVQVHMSSYEPVSVIVNELYS